MERRVWPWVVGAAGFGALGAAWALRSSSGGVPGTIFTIVFENKSLNQVIGSPSAPYFTALARQYASATSYRYAEHPSLPAYVVMTSGSTRGITDDTGYVVPGTDNLAAQLDAAGIPWRAYGEGMPTPCARGYSGRWMPRHMPFLYYDYVVRDAGYCASHVVPMNPYFAQDLASDAFRYMWLTPDACSDMHDCSVATGDAWLARVLPQIFAAPGYRRGGVVFILFDEGSGDPRLPALVISPRLRNPGQSIDVPMDHRVYLATVEDLLGLPRLPSTQSAASVARLVG